MFDREGVALKSADIIGVHDEQWKENVAEIREAVFAGLEREVFF